MRTSARKMEVNLDQMYNVADVVAGYKYWFSKLLNITLSMFDWEGLPENLPAREIEVQLQLYGHCVVFIKNGKLVTTQVDTYDIDDYYQPTEGVYAQPILGSGNLTLNGYDNCLIWNNSLKDNVNDIPVDNNLFSFISRYSRRLADVESTSNIYTVNNRSTNYPIAKNDKVRKSLEKFFNMLSLGKMSAISDDAIIEGFTVQPIPKNTSVDDIIKWEDARDKILEQFWRDLGVKFRNNKRAQMSDEEVEADEQVLLISLDDMLKCRQEGVKLLNEKFGLSVTVRINPRFNREEIRSNERYSEPVSE